MMVEDLSVMVAVWSIWQMPVVLKGPVSEVL